MGELTTREGWEEKIRQIRTSDDVTRVIIEDYGWSGTIVSQEGRDVCIAIKEPTFIRPCFEALASIVTIRTIILRIQLRGIDDIQATFSFECFTRLTKLMVQSLYMTKQQAKVLGDKLATLTTLTSLQLCSVFVIDNGKIVNEGLNLVRPTSFHSLRKLSLISVRGANVTGICSDIARSTVLRRLDLVDIELSSDTVISLLGAMRNNRSLTHFTYHPRYFNVPLDHEARHFGTFFAIRNIVYCSFVLHSSVRDVVLGTLEHNHTLIGLDLHVQGRLPRHACMSIVRFVRNNSVLRTFCLTASVFDPAVVDIATEVRVRTDLVEFVLRGNFPTEGVTSLVDVREILSGHTLSRLYLQSSFFLHHENQLSVIVRHPNSAIPQSSPLYTAPVENAASV